ncbi:MAG: trypsin-like peptidase domain-containing protein, partial [Trichormus sp.]
MRVAGVLSALLFGTAIVIVQPVATALTPSEIAEIAQQITVRIDGANTGSGVIIERQGNVYTVVTNWHVVQLKGNYTVHTPDGKKYTFNHSQVKQFRGVDLAIFQFTSNENYRVAEKGNSDQIKLGINISVAGYPQGTSSIRFLRGAISSLESKPKNGYAFVYDIGGFPGMSGGAILDEQGKLVGIHGRATTRPDTNATTVLGIPLQIYLSLAPSVQSVATAPTPSKINPQNAQAYYNQGVIYYEQKKWELALADFNKAIAINPQNANAYIYRGNIYYDQKKWELALADFNKAIAINPQDALAYYNRGNIYRNQKKWELALADFNKAIAI